MNKHVLQGYQMTIQSKKINKCITLLRERMTEDGRSYFAKNLSYHLKGPIKKRMKHRWIKAWNRKAEFKKQARLAQLAER